MRPVLVTTEYRGVFFGHADDTSGDNITLHKARNCIYWPSANGGFCGLASEGPAKGAPAPKNEAFGAREAHRCDRLGGSDAN